MALAEVLTSDSAITLLDHLVGEMPNAFGLCRVRPPQPQHKPRSFVKHVLDGRDRSAQDDPRGPGASGSC